MENIMTDHELTTPLPAGRERPVGQRKSFFTASENDPDSFGQQMIDLVPWEMVGLILRNLVRIFAP